MSSDLYSRLVDDTGFFRRVEAEYCGDDDLLDVAWWLEHPNKDTPAGRLAPTHAIRALQHQLYARSTSEEDRQEAAEAIRELQENVAASQAQLIEAVAKAEAPGASASAPLEVKVARPRKWWPVVAAGAAVVIGMTGFGAGLAATDSDAGATSSPPSASPSRPEPVIVAFERPQAAEDLPAWIPPGFESDTFRRLSQDEAGGVEAFIARDQAEMICLVVVTQPDQEFFSSCALDIPIGGLGVQYRESGAPQADGTVAPGRYAFALLRRDGGFATGGG